MRGLSGARGYAAAILVSAGLLAGCGGDSGSGGGDGAAPAQEVTSGDKDAIKIGLLAGVTGDYAPYTKDAIEAGKIALGEINATGGPLGRKLDLVVADNQSTSTGAIPAFDKLAEVDKVTAISGLESDAALALLDSFAERQIPAMCPQCGSVALDTKGGNYLWRVIASDSDVGIADTQIALNRNFKKMAILVQKSEGYLSSAEAFKPVYEKHGEICAEVQFEPGKTSYQTEVAKAFGCNPDAVFVSSGYEAAIPILQEWQRRNYKKPFITTADYIVPEVAEKAPENLAAFAPTVTFDREGAAAKRFVKAFEEATGEAPSEALWQNGQYDSIMILALAIEAAGSTDGAAIAAEVPKVTDGGTECSGWDDCSKLLKDGKDIRYHGVTGNLAFNEHGNVKTALFNEQAVENGEWVVKGTINLDKSLAE